jgi:hypothetical protein
VQSPKFKAQSYQKKRKRKKKKTKTHNRLITRWHKLSCIPHPKIYVEGVPPKMVAFWRWDLWEIIQVE